MQIGKYDISFQNYFNIAMKLPQNLQVVFQNIITLILKNYTFPKMDRINHFIMDDT